MPNIGVYGGSVDPIHFGHLLLAEFCREQAQLDEVWFVPVKHAPHKIEGPIASDKHRLEMLQIATWGQSDYRVNALEIERGGISYTVDTLEQLTQSAPESKFFLLMGADSLNEFSTWREPTRICELAIPLVVVRGGEAEPDWTILQNYLAGDLRTIQKRHRIEFPAVDLSSSEIRHRLSQGKSIRFQTPRSIEQYICANNLYKVQSEAASGESS
ncbi:MAG: nicotinate-nucleotide adenylyltransferase [Planctomycetota bacterium]|nr:nicotinate-nucleotide adenylyltransferase [Planctomycetota bacterium]